MYKIDFNLQGSHPSLLQILWGHSTKIRGTIVDISVVAVCTSCVKSMDPSPFLFLFPCLMGEIPAIFVGKIHPTVKLVKRRLGVPITSLPIVVMNFLTVVMLKLVCERRKSAKTPPPRMKIKKTMCGTADKIPACMETKTNKVNQLNKTNHLCCF